MANEPNGEPVIAIDSDEEGEHAKCADAEAMPGVPHGHLQLQGLVLRKCASLRTYECLL